MLNLTIPVVVFRVECQTNVDSGARNCNGCWERDQQFFFGLFVLAPCSTKIKENRWKMYDKKFMKKSVDI